MQVSFWHWKNKILSRYCELTLLLDGQLWAGLAKPPDFLVLSSLSGIFLGFCMLFYEKPQLL